MTARTTTGSRWAGHDVAKSFEVSGFGELRRALDRAGDLAQQALESAMFEEMSRVISDAQSLTPVDTGALRSSGTVLRPRTQGTRTEVTAGFGGAASAYAVVVHERMGVHHPVGQAKFLEQPFLARAPKMPANLARRVAKAWERLRVR